MLGRIPIRLFAGVAALPLVAVTIAWTGVANGAPPVAATMGNDVAAYVANCASCHGANLAGTFGPPLKGAAFKAKWSAQGAQALHDYIVKAMPPGDPGSLSADDYQQITSYLQSANGINVQPSATVGAAPSAGPAQPSVNKRKPQAPAEAAGGENDKLTGGGITEDARYKNAMASRTRTLTAIQPVKESDLRAPSPEDWLNSRRTDDGQAYSPLTQISRQNAGSLEMAWSLSLPVGTNGITPIVRNGIIFLNSAGTILAIDARTGEALWKFARPTSTKMIGPPITQARGMAILGDSLFVPTTDNHIIALDVRSGKVVWDRVIAGMQNWMRFTANPIVVHGKVIQGASGCWSTGEGGKCFVVALDSTTGEEVWRTRTIPRPEEPGGDTWNGASYDQRGGASMWATPTYDPDSNLVYFGTGGTYHIATLLEPKPERRRENSGLYNDSTLALDPDTGKLVWSYQHIARDVWDLDWAFERILATLPVAGKPTRVVMTMGKIGILDVLDARSGKYLFSFDLGFQNLVTKIDPKTGWKTTNPAAEPSTDHAVTICPYSLGVRSWPATSYDPVAKLLYVGATPNSCMDYSWIKGDDFDFGIKNHPVLDTDGNYGRVIAINLATRKVEWSRAHRAPPISATLATAGGLVFEGGRDRMFRASNSATGKVLWQTKLNHVPNASPVTFAVDGVQYVAVTSGGGAPNEVLRSYMTPEIENPAPSTTLWVFRLGGPKAGTAGAN
jgi:alcohol dehydrogenase (cytochrome c)